AQTNIRYHPGARVVAIDRPARKIFMQGGDALTYDKLLIATGSRARRLPAMCTGDAPVHYLRTLEDSLALRRQFAPGRRVAVIGGGFIGLEVAAAAIKNGCEVTILEAQPRVLSRGMPSLVSEWVDRLHRDRGVDIRLSASSFSLRQTQ